MLAGRGLPVLTWLQAATGKTCEEFQKKPEGGISERRRSRVRSASHVAGAAQSMGGSVRGLL